jgi:hypothetical protein
MTEGFNMSEDYYKQIEVAVMAVRREEGKNPFAEEYAKTRIEFHLADNFTESLKGKGTMPVPDSFFRLQRWACYEYCFKLLQEHRRRDAVEEHEQNQARSAKG